MPRVKKFDINEVLLKAMELFWEKGYHATSIQDLVDGLGINRGSLYDTYGGKKKLFNQAIEIYMSSNQKLLCDLLGSEGNVKGTLRMVFEKIVDADISDADCKGCFVVNTTTELLPNDIGLQESITDYKKNIIQMFHELLQKGIKKGEIPKNKDIKTIANLLYTLMTGIRVISKTETNKKESLDEVDAVLMLLN